MTGGESNEDFILTRVFDAPRDLVWQAWTDPARMAKWWGPKGFELDIAKFDLRPGGTFHYCMKGPDGFQMWGKFVFREIAAPGRLVYVLSFSDRNGNTTRHPMSPDWPLEMLNTVSFDDVGGKTKLTIVTSAINATESERKTFVAGHKSMHGGFKGTLDKLEELLANG